VRDERRNHPLQTTALVHEAYLRLIDVNRVDWESRNHFFVVSAQMLGVPAETVMRDWRMARLWLQRDLSAA